jgi:hypothetical protein
MDTKRKNVSSITHPREVESRRDIELLFEDMTMQDLSKVVEKGDINTVIMLRNQKFGQSSTPDMSKNKRVKYNEDINEEVLQNGRNDDKLLEQKVIQQSLAFQRELLEFRQMRMSFTKSSLKKAMERQSIGSSGYGRFLCSHYNPGSSFISSLNSISQKYDNKIKEKKRLQKELLKKEERKNLPKSEEKKEESKDTKIEDKQIEKDKGKKVLKIESKLVSDGKQDSKEESKPQDLPDESSKSQQNKSEVKVTKDALKPKIQKNIEGKVKPDQKPKPINKQKEEGKVIKPKPKSTKQVKVSNIDKPVDKIEEDLKNEINIDELHKCVSSENHNDMVDNILSQNNTRISNKAIKAPIKQLSKPKSRDSKSDTINNSNDDDKDLGFKRVQKLESKEQEDKENNDGDKKDQKEVKPKLKKVKEPKPKKIKIDKPKKIIPKIPNKERYKGSVIKKKFAPKKIGAINSAPKSEENSNTFNVVAQIESDDEKNEIDVTRDITIITEPLLNIVSSIDHEMQDDQSEESETESKDNKITNEMPTVHENEISKE